MIRTSLVLTALVLIAGSRGVVGSGSILTPVAEVHVENGHEEACIEDASGLCLASMHGDEPGSLMIDTYQRFDYIGLATNDSFLEERGVLLLPDGAVRINASDLVFPQPVIPLLTDAIGTVWAPSPLSGFGVVMTEEASRVHYVHPDPREPSGWRSNFIGPSYGTRDFRYDHVGPFNDLGEADTDTYVTSVWDEPCAHFPELDCAREARILSDAYARSTPNVRNGVEWHITEAASDPDALSPPGVARKASGPSAPSSLRRDPVSHGEPFSVRERPVDLAVLRPNGLTLSSVPPGPTLAPQEPPGPPAELEPKGSALPRDARVPLALAAGLTLLVLVAIAAALYSRIRDREHALALPQRARIAELVRERGACSMQDLCAATGKGWTAVEHHVRILERHGFLHVVREGGCVEIRCPQGDGGRGLLSRSPIHRQVYDMIAERADGISRRELRDLTPEVADRTRNHALRQLIKRGVVEASGVHLRARTDG